MKTLSLRIVASLASSAVFMMASVAGYSQAAPANGPVEDMHGLKVQEIHPVPTPSPFPLTETGQVPTRAALEFRAPEAMTAADRELVAANEAEIARRAELQGFRLGGEGSGRGGWGYEQAVCPVFPEHVILEYSRNDGPGDYSLFSVVIPRAEGHVRVIPVKRRSNSLWTPAPSNALTLNDFNHMVIEQHAGVDPDWLTIGLCYGALAGGHVRAALQARTPEEEHYPLFVPAKLTVSGKGGAEVRFADVMPHRDPKDPSGETEAKAMEWVMTFAQSGRLLKVKRSVAGELYVRSVPQTATEVKGVPVAQTVVDVRKTGN